MAILEAEGGLLEALSGEMTPKFLATRSADGVPNVVPCISLLPADDQDDTLFFGNFLLRKSIKNLEEDPRLAILQDILQFFSLDIRVHVDEDAAGFQYRIQGYHRCG